MNIRSLVLGVCVAMHTAHGSQTHSEIMKIVIQASESANISLIEETIKKIENINSQDKDGQTPLHYAAQHGHVDLVKVLLDAHANPNIPEKTDGHTPLHRALIEHDEAVVKTLLNGGANSNELTRSGLTPMNLLLSGNQVVIPRDGSHGEQVTRKGLRIAEKKKIEKILKALIEKGADFRATHDMNTPLHYAAARGLLDIAELLLKKGINVDSVNHEQVTPLYLAADANERTIVELLIKYEAEVNIKNIYGHTPLMAAAVQGSHKMAELLLDSHADVNAADSDKWTPLHYAARAPSKLIALLVQRGADRNAKTLEDQRIPLHRAVSVNSMNINLFFLSEEQIDAQDVNGDTPLHIAAYSGYVDAIKILLDNRARTTIKNNDGLTPLEVAHAHRQSEKIIQLLSSYSATASKTGPFGKNAAKDQNTISAFATKYPLSALALPAIVVITTLFFLKFCKPHHPHRA